MFPTVKSKDLLWKHFLLPIIKYLFSRDSFECPIWIFIFDTYLQGQNLKFGAIPVKFVHFPVNTDKLKATACAFEYLPVFKQ
jgi:hypothetical protein